MPGGTQNLSVRQFAERKRSIRRRALRCALLALLILSGTPDTAASNPEPTVVIVHGAWGGAWSFRETATELERLGAVVYRPTLTGLGKRQHLARPEVGLSTHIEDVVQLLRVEDLNDVVLVGHSYGGMVVTGVAAREEPRIRRLVYVDAYLPESGESVFDLMPTERVTRLEGLAKADGDGWRIPPYWPDPGLDVAQPIETFRESLTFDPKVLGRIPGAYVLTMEPGASIDRFSPFAERAAALGWPQRLLRTDHNPQRSMPVEFAQLLAELAGRKPTGTGEE